jgi:hypothetical protein
MPQRSGPALGVDWFRVITDLASAGLRLRGIADAIDVPTATLIGWKQGAEPKHIDGDRLIALWMTETGQARDAVPRAPYWRRHA